MTNVHVLRYPVLTLRTLMLPSPSVVFATRTEIEFPTSDLRSAPPRPLQIRDLSIVS